VLVALALMPAAAGCAVYHPINAPGLENPACDSGNERFPGKKVRYCSLLALDQDGSPFPDATQKTVDAARLARCHYRLSEYYKEDPSYDPDQIFDDLARQVTAQCGSDRTLIVLIHGFCSTMPETRRSYKATRRQIEFVYPSQKFAYLEVYWDGLYGSPLSIWSTAQTNSKWAGLGLRKLLTKLPPSIPTRVITHSRGASVICAALWNDELRGSVAEDRRYRDAQQKLPPPVLPGLRIGMLAPAMRPCDLESYFERGEGAFCFHDRLVLGINPDDHALNCGGLFWVMGTSLGCSPDAVDSGIAPRLNRGRAHVFRVDFSGSVEHAFEDYVMRDVFEDEFLPKLLGEPETSNVAAR
jgi:hypothetical protein